jgi:hypothetical protein
MQENAWADERVMLEWHTLFKTDTVSLGQEELLLGLDNHGAQSTIKFRSCLREAHTQPAYTPPGPDAPYVCNFCVFPPIAPYVSQIVLILCRRAIITSGRS